MEDEIVKLDSILFSGADLRGANLREDNLSGADLREANLSGANLYCIDCGDVTEYMRCDNCKDN